MDTNLELKRYASAFACFLLKNLDKKQLEKTSSILLFGSAAQNRAGKNSDVDIFIDTDLSKSQIRKFRSRILKLKEDFLLSNEGLHFKSRGIFNTINTIVGNLSEWEEMKKSISSSGIVFYGRYRAGFAKRNLRHSIIFFWEAETKSRGAFLNKLYGYSIKGKRYPGLIEKLGGKKTGKSAAIIPVEHSQEFMKTLKHYKISYKAMEVFC